MTNGEVDRFTPEEQRYLETRRAELRTLAQANDKEGLKVKFSEIKPNADRTRIEIGLRIKNVEERRSRSLADPPFEGDVDATGTMKNNLAVTSVYVKEILKLYGDAPQLIPVDVNSPSGKTITNMVAAIEAPGLFIDQYSAPYVYKVLHQAINNQIVEPIRTLTDNELRDLFSMAPRLGERVITALGRAQGLNETEIINRIETIISDITRESQVDNLDQALIGLLSPASRTFYESLYSTTKFTALCEQLRNSIELELSRDIPNFQNLPADRRQQLVAEEISFRLKEKISEIVYRIYDRLLREKKDQPFDNVERTIGGYFENPGALFDKLMKRIDTLRAGIRKDIGVEFALPMRERVTMYDPITGEVKTIEKVLPLLEKTKDAKEFVQHLYEYTSSEKKRIQFPYNLEYLYRNVPSNKDKPFYDQLGQFAHHSVKSSEVDEIWTDRMSENVQRVLSTFIQKNEKFFVDSNWRRDPTATEEFFSNVTTMEDTVLTYLKKKYKAQWEREEWKYQRAILNAKLILYGVYFKPTLLYSYADPNLTQGGKPTIAGEQEMGLALHKPGSAGQRFQDPTLTLGSLDPKDPDKKYGVDWMIYNREISPFHYEDSNKHRLAWQLSNIRGRAAYFDLAGDDWNTVKAFIDIDNITKSGGVETSSSWRLQLAYLDWIRDYLTPDNAINYSPDKPAVLVDMWKRLENIGIDVLENYVDKFVLGGLPKKNYTEGVKPEKLEAFKNFFGFLYDRYLNSDEGKKTFLKKEGGGILTKNEYIQNVEKILTDKRYYSKERDAMIKGLIYDAFTIVMFERLPLKFIFLEKQRYSQNGELLINRIRKEFVDELTGEQQVKVRKFDDAVDDLILVQTETRLRVSRDMDDLLKDANIKNVYGNLNDQKSLVNNGRGYVIDEQVIEEVLRDELRIQEVPENEITERIQNAKKIYRQLKAKVVTKLEEAKWEIEEKDPKEKEKIKTLQSQYVTRMQWFKKMYVGGEFVFSPSSEELALKFINLSASGPDTLERTANYCRDTAEKIALEWYMLDKLTEARAKKDLNPLIANFEEIMKSVRSQLGSGEAADIVPYRFLQRALYWFRRDTSVQHTLFGLDWARNVSSSFSEAENGGPRTGDGNYELTPNQLNKVIAEATGAGGKKIFQTEAAEPEVKRRIRVSKKYKILGKILEKVVGREIDIEEINWVNTVSREGMNRLSQSNLASLFRVEVLPRLIIITLIIAAILSIKAGSKDLTFAPQT